MGDDFRKTIEEIQARADIVEIISGYLPLKKAGGSYKGLCPFHQEKTPSFIVSPGKQIYHCFGCGAGGDVISFIMKHENMEFMDAVRLLAERTGVTLPRFRREGQQVSYSKLIYRVNELAATYYNSLLIGSSRAISARRYIKDRTINADMVSRFKLGYAPDGWEGLIRYAQDKGVKPSALQRCGLALPGKQEGFYDMFRNRIIFPIFDVRSKIIGFGARALDDSTPKYINSPETDAYKKGSHLYGLNLSSDAVRQKNEVIIVEGYFDLIIPFQNGIDNIVATLGTALTVEQIRLIRRYTKNTTIVFDSDEAGEAASLRSLDLLVGEGLNVRIVNLPPEYDPDSFICKKSVEEFSSLLEQAESLFDYKLKILTAKFDKNTIENKIDIISEMLPTIKRVGNEVLKRDYIKRLSQALSVDEQALLAELAKVRLDYSTPQAKPVTKPYTEISSAEKLVVAFAVEDMNMAKEIKDNLDTEDIRYEPLRQILKAVYVFAEKNEEITPAKLIYTLNDEKTSELICHLVAESENVVDREKSLSDCIKRIKADNLKSRKNELINRIAEAEKTGDAEGLMALMKELNDLRSVKI